jgi:type I restriction enzyme, S subunit
VKEGSLPRDWKLEALGKVSSVIQYGYTAKAQSAPVGPRLLRITDIQNDAVRWDEVPFCKIKEGEKPKYLLARNDILFARTGATVGKSYLIRNEVPDSVFASYLIRVRLTGEVDPKYLAYFFKSPDYWRQISESQAGIGQPNVNGTKLAQLQIPVAPAQQQQIIVGKIEKQFSRLDEAVASLKRTKANLKRYKAAVLKAAVEGKLTEDWRKQHPNVEPASKLLERILAERRKKASGSGKYIEPEPVDAAGLPPLPKSWTWARLEQLGMIFGGLTKNPKRAKLTKKLPYLRVANVYANELRLGDIENIGVQHSELEKLLLRRGDLLVVEGNGSKDQIGRLAVWDGSIDPCVHQNHLIKARLIIASMNKWILFWLLSPIGRNFIDKVSSSTSGLYTLSVNKVGDLPIIVPPVAEQEQIVAEVERRLSVIDELEATVEANLTRADRLRQSILQRAFLGKFAVELGPHVEPINRERHVELD